jgi:hypothetical protein
MIYPPLPEVGSTQRVVELHRKGLGSWAIRKVVWPQHPERKRVVVESILSDPEKYDTHIDEVAVERAFRGDRKVWANMTHYERRALIDKVEEHYNADRGNPRWPEAHTQGQGAVGYGLGAPIGEQKSWVLLLCEELGEPPYRFLDILSARRRRARAKAATCSP